ncbi:MAG: DctP family TRAP transporter solute-binding subunit [Tissierellia bacterium]|nr:DctP family TRAP transporter solute-binding subunit [Tissierellia bacterium]
MKKRLLALLLLFALALTACGPKTAEPATTEAAATGETEEAAEVAEPTEAIEGEPVTIKWGSITSENHSSFKAAEKFKEHVEKASGGNIKVELYPNALLGGDVQMVESVALGTLEMALPATSVFTMYSTKFGVIDMPYMFSDMDKAFEALDGEVGQILDAELENVGIKNLGYGFNGVRNMTNNTRPITKPEDLEGVKMRVMENPVFIDLFTYLGSNPTPMSFGELFTALQQKTVDGQENPASLIFESKFQEVQKYFSETKHVYNFLGNIINKAFYDGLSDQQRAVLDEGAKLYLCDWQRKTENEENDMYIEKLAEAGMEVNRLSEDEIKVFAEKLAPMYDKYRGEIGDELFDMLEPYR